MRIASILALAAGFADLHAATESDPLPVVSEAEATLPGNKFTVRQRRNRRKNRAKVCPSRTGRKL